jgi:hypothetical protein
MRQLRRRRLRQQHQRLRERLRERRDKQRGACLEQLRAHRATGGKVLSQSRERDARAPEPRLQRGLLRDHSGESNTHARTAHTCYRDTRNVQTQKE